MPVSENELKFNFLKRVYFGVSDNPDDDVNPFQDLISFGKAKVGTLRWGFNSETRQRSKVRFAHNYYTVLQHYRVVIKVEDIFSALEDDNTNDEVVGEWLKKANFSTN